MLDPRALRPHYTAFLRDDRVLLTGHSHQAWPDVARAGMVEAFDDAARLVDDKWGRAFEAADDVREAVARILGADKDEIALGQNTHELVVRFLSALDLAGRPRLVTTRGEFHSITRQLLRLEEDGRVQVTWIDPAPVETLATRLAAAVDGRTSAVLASTVLFETAQIVPGTAALVRAAREEGAHVLLDAYHGFNVVPATLASLGAADAFVVGGGYKYAEWGEGVCFLRVPAAGLALRPVLTGWFAGFAGLGARQDSVAWGELGKDLFAGATYDPTGHYRARRVARFMQAQGMTPAALRELSLRQTGRILAGLDGLGLGPDVCTPRDPDARGGFVAVRVQGGDVAEVVRSLRARGILVDARGDLVRLGPAPYVTDEEIDRGITALREILRR